jgi:hypothetical protein
VENTLSGNSRDDSIIIKPDQVHVGIYIESGKDQWRKVWHIPERKKSKLLIYPIMTLLQLLFTLFIAVLIGVVFYYIFNARGPWGRFWSFFLVLVLVAIASATWIPPIGPVYWDVAWLTVGFIVLLFALFLAAASPPGRTGRAQESEPAEIPKGPGDMTTTAAVVLNVFFWIFILFLLVVVLWGIFTPREVII